MLVSCRRRDLPGGRSVVLQADSVVLSSSISLIPDDERPGGAQVASASEGEGRQQRRNGNS